MLSLILQMTGAPLEVTIRFQANLLVRPIEELSIFQDVPRIFIPAMWFEQKFVMDSDMVSQIRTAVKVPWIGRMVGFVCLAIGIILILVATFMALIKFRKEAERQRLGVNLGDEKIAVRLNIEDSPLLDRLTRPQIIMQTKDLKRPHI